MVAATKGSPVSKSLTIPPSTNNNGGSANDQISSNPFPPCRFEVKYPLLFEKGKVKLAADLIDNTRNGHETGVYMGENVASKITD